MTVSILEENPSRMSCYLLVGDEYDQNITWTWSYKNMSLKPTCLMSIQSEKRETSLNFNSTVFTDKGVYYCTATNQYGSFTRAISLRIKSKFLNVRSSKLT
jgi:hypothetical protein